MNDTNDRVSSTGRLIAPDLFAGLTVALVLVPQSIAYASLAGMPPVYGIYAAALPPIAAAFFASSPYLQTGPVAMTSVLTFGALSAIAVPFSDDYVALAALLALIVGIVRIIIGVARAGFITYLMSEPVLTGFTSAAAILIALAQLPTLVGVQIADNGVIGGAFHVLMAPLAWSWTDVTLGLLALACIFGGRRLHPSFPGALVAVVAGILFSKTSGYEGAVVGMLPTDWPPLSLELPWAMTRELLLPGLVIALVGFAEPAAIARAIATQTRTHWNADREFVSQGVANITAALSAAFPVGGSFSRTMINRAAGGRTRWSGMVTGAFVLVFIPFASTLESLPRSIIAAIVIAAVVNLMKARVLVDLIRVSRAQAVVGWTTFVLTLALAPRIDQAMLIGIAMGVAVHLWRERRVQVNAAYEAETGELRLEPVGVIFFGSTAALSDALMAALAAEPAARALTIDLRKVGRIDYTGAAIITGVARDAEVAGLRIHIISGQRPQGRELLERLLGADSPWLSKSPPGA